MTRSQCLGAMSGALIALLSFSAHAQQAPELRATGPSVAQVPWRGSRVFYGHSFTALSLNPNRAPAPAYETLRESPITKSRNTSKRGACPAPA